MPEQHGFWIPVAGNQATGDGTSTVSNCTGLAGGTFFIDS